MISHVYSSDNKGDHAILEVLVDELERVFDEPSITILTMDDGLVTGEILGKRALTSLHGVVRRRSDTLHRAAFAAWLTLRCLVYALRVRRSAGRPPSCPPEFRAAICQ